MSSLCIIKFQFIYPNATSKIIITTNPIATPIVPIFECSPACDSGISSSTTTYIIAPAANESIYGSIGITALVNSIVIIAPIGSTTPENAPYINAFVLLIPSLFNGIDIIAPSGKFCMAIPITNELYM